MKSVIEPITKTISIASAVLRTGAIRRVNEGKRKRTRMMDHIDPQKYSDFIPIRPFLFLM